MDILLTVVLVVHVLVALGIIGLVLLQHGKGAEMGAGFGAGASGSLFGASGSANFLSRTTAILAAIFFVTSLGLAFLAVQKPRASGGVMDAVKDSAPADSGAAVLPELRLLVLRQTACRFPQFPCLPYRQLLGLVRPAQKTPLLATPVSEAGVVEFRFPHRNNCSS